jgi:hypothetical protein
MTNYVIVYAFDAAPEPRVADSLQLADRLQLIRGEQHPDLWVSWSGFHQVEPALAAALAAGQVRSAALLPTVPPPSDRWILTNWHGQLVVHGSIASHLDPRFWVAAANYDLIDMRVFLPSSDGPPVITGSPAANRPTRRPEWVETAAEYRASLDTGRPTLITVPVEQVTSQMHTWFGDLADDRVGGAIAVLAMSGVRRSTRSQVVLRNPAALGLARVAGSNNLAALVKSGAVSVRAWGVSSDDPTRSPRRQGRGRLRIRQPRPGIRSPELTRLLTEELTTAKRTTGARYGVMIELTAAVDSVLRTDSGLVFEQEQLNGVQNLAIAEVMMKRADAGRPLMTALAAWCLNRLLAPPSGQPVRPTPLFLPLAAGTDQDAVWTIAERPLRSFGASR